MCMRRKTANGQLQSSDWQQGRMITKKYEVTETKEEKFQEAAINSAWRCLQQIRKTSAREKRPLSVTRTIRKLKLHADEGEFLKDQKHQQWFHFPPRVALLITTLDDNKLDDFTPTPKSWFFGQVSMGMAASIAKRSKTVLSERKTTHFFQLEDSKDPGSSKQLFVKASNASSLVKHYEWIFYLLGPKLKSNHATPMQGLKHFTLKKITLKKHFYIMK